MTTGGLRDLVPGWARVRPGARVVDVVLAAVLLVSVLVSVRTTPPEQLATGSRGYDVLGVGLLVLQQLLALGRRWRPLALLVLAVGVQALLRRLGYPALTADGTVLFVLLYSAGAYGLPSRWRRFVAVPAVVAAAVSTLLGPYLVWDNLIGLSAIYGGIFFVGGVVRRQRADQVALAAAADRAREHHDVRLRQAVLDERAHIARELHDIVAHSLAFIVAEADAGRRVLDADPGRSREALTAVGDTGRSGLREMRRLLLVLRSDGDPAGQRDDLAPQPGLADLDVLVGSVRGAGLPVRLTVHGETGPLPPALELSAYRIVQEALTNVLKHAGPARTFVDIRHGAEVLSIEVLDTGRRAADPAEPEDVPHGLIGMRERAALFGGRVDAGPLPGGGWRVTAVLPVDRGVAPSAALPTHPRAPVQALPPLPRATAPEVAV